jgi:hypothetical protein
MLSLRVFANWLSFWIPCATVTLVEVPTTMTAAVEPSKKAGTSEYTISQATSSFHRYTLSAGLGDLKAFLRIVPVGIRANWVVCSNVFLIVSTVIQPKRGCSRLKSGSLFTVGLGIISFDDARAPKVSASHAS